MSVIDNIKNRGSLPDISQFSTSDGGDVTKLMPPEQIGREDAETLAGAGIILDGGSRSGTMVVRNHQPVCLTYDRDKFEMLPISIALERYEWLREKYYFKAVPADYDEAVKSCAAQKKPLGFFIRVKKGADVTLPCQVAMYMASENVAQLVHNIVVLEDDSHLELITGCMTHHSVNAGLHLAVEEHYIGKNARFVSTMIHSWGSDIMVYPRTGTIVEENGRYESNYISLRAAKQVMSDPQTYLNGKGASAKYLTVVLGAPGSVIDTQGKVHLNAEDTSAELMHRGVCTGGAMYQGGLLIGSAPCKAHVDCAGMLLDNTGEGFIESIPGLRSHHPDARMSHEASIGKIAPEQVEYLMSRGMDEREAISLLIRGFLGADIEGLGAELDAQIAEIAEVAGHGEG
ncbi:SufD family Fe-S cluster assembly protein [Acetobacterium carbinolicum]|uniref:SufD family Fe-S cluster assembly protein n=1 Tax=Acetobacterium carbinolicum TaxID=52690 RepID=UPI0039C9DFE2